MAFLVAKNTSERIEDIMWTMPIQQTFKLVSLIYTANTGETVKTHEERQVMRKQQEAFKEVTGG